MQEVNPVLFSCQESIIEWVAKAFNVDRSTALGTLRTGKFDDGNLFRAQMMCAVMNKSYNMRIMLEDIDYTLPKYPLSGMTTQQCLCDSIIHPFTNCKYRKVSPHAAKFLFGLGAPDETLIRKYREHLRNKVATDGTAVEYLPGYSANVYEELLMVPLNGHYEYFYLCASEEHCMFIHQRAPKCGEHEFKLMPLGYDGPTLNPGGSALSYDENYQSGGSRSIAEAFANGFVEATTIFDVEAFLANLWISEETNTFKPAWETAEERKPVDTLCKLRNVKPMKQAVSYTYIRITDEAWSKFKFERAEDQRAAGTYTKAVWYVRPHYAYRWDKMVLIRGHFAYRKCGPVVDVPKVDVIV